MLLLALTGFDAPGDVIRSVEYGFDHHLVKPIDPDQLTRLLRDPAEGSASV
jgi:two-component system CheB/CheR fusion protein